MKIHIDNTDDDKYLRDCMRMAAGCMAISAFLLMTCIIRLAIWVIWL